MKILDIGAGIKYVMRKSSNRELPRSRGGIQEAQIRWLHRNTARQVMHALGAQHLEIHGIDLTPPENFADGKL